MRHRETLERPANAPAVGHAQRIEGEVGSIQARADDALDRQVPAVALILVLSLRSEIRDFVLDSRGRAAELPAQEVVARRARRRCGPHDAGNEFQQLRLAGPVGAGQHPAFPWPYGPADVLEDVAPAAVQTEVREAHFEVPRAGAAHRAHWITAAGREWVILCACANATAAARAPILAHLGWLGVVTCNGVAAVPVGDTGRNCAGRGAAATAERRRQNGATQPRVVLSRTVPAGA